VTLRTLAERGNEPEGRGPGRRTFSRLAGDYRRERKKRNCSKEREGKEKEDRPEGRVVPAISRITARGSATEERREKTQGGEEKKAAGGSVSVVQQRRGKGKDGAHWNGSIALTSLSPYFGKEKKGGKKKKKSKKMLQAFSISRHLDACQGKKGKTGKKRHARCFSTKKRT